MLEIESLETRNCSTWPRTFADTNATFSNSSRGSFSRRRRSSDRKRKRKRINIFSLIEKIEARYIDLCFDVSISCFGYLICDCPRAVYFRVVDIYDIFY